jgi:hypothetical protein
MQHTNFFILPPVKVFYDIPWWICSVNIRGPLKMCSRTFSSFRNNDHPVPGYRIELPGIVRHSNTLGNAARSLRIKGQLFDFALQYLSGLLDGRYQGRMYPAVLP